jgi:hypothetical protein
MQRKLGPQIWLADLGPLALNKSAQVNLEVYDEGASCISALNPMVQLYGTRIPVSVS